MAYVSAMRIARVKHLVQVCELATQAALRSPKLHAQGLKPPTLHPKGPLDSTKESAQIPGSTRIDPPNSTYNI